jgi:hypothetical protein
MTDQSGSNPYNARWETVEHGWRAVVADVENSPRFTAFVKYVGAPYWRIWAGRLFDTLEDAQAWCREEIATQLHKTQIDEIEKPWHAEPPAWRWLWETLSQKIGEQETLVLRNGLAERLREGGDQH